MKNYFLFFLAIFLVACTSKKQNSVSTTRSLEEQVISTWEGEIPCADCPGILYTLDLKNDNLYSGKLVYLEKSVDPFASNGTWSIDAEGKIVLTPSTKGSSSQFLLYNGEYVEMLDADGKKIETKLNYKLYKIDSAKNSNALNENIDNEIDFKATGNEPFWLLEIDSEKNMHFNVLGGIEITTPAGKEIKSQDTNVTRFYSESEQGTIEVQLIKKICIDNMSGIENDYSVNVQVRQKADKVYQEFSGCGNYMADLRLRPKQEPK